MQRNCDTTLLLRPSIVIIIQLRIISVPLRSSNRNDKERRRGNVTRLSYGWTLDYPDCDRSKRIRDATITWPDQAQLISLTGGVISDNVSSKHVNRRATRSRFMLVVTVIPRSPIGPVHYHNRYFVSIMKRYSRLRNGTSARNATARRCNLPSEIAAIGTETAARLKFSPASIMVVAACSLESINRTS